MIDEPDDDAPDDDAPDDDGLLEWPSEEDIAEGKLMARDYEAWANL